MDQSEFSAVVEHYHEHPEPGRLVDALEWAGTVVRPKDAVGVVYFFARVGMSNPGILKGFRGLLERGPTEAADFTRAVLRLLEGRGTRAALLSAIRESVGEETRALQASLARLSGLSTAKADPPVVARIEMDCTWAEFYLTGDPRIVLPIIEVLGWPDLLGAKLGEWKRTHSAGKAARLVRSLLERGFDPGSEDLDLSAATLSMAPSPRRLAAVRRALPFTLASADLEYIAAKTAALWSVRSHAESYAGIRRLCGEASVDERARRRLQEILADLSFVWNCDDDTAREASAAPVASLGVLDLAWLACPMDAGAGRFLGVPSGRRVAEVCANNVLAASSYLTRVEMTSPGDSGKLEYRIGIAHGGRARVARRALPDDDYDEWVTIGERHWPFGLIPSIRDQESRETRAWSVERLAEVLRHEEPRTVQRHCQDGVRFTVLIYLLDEIPGARSSGDLPSSACRIELWVHEPSKVLARAVLDTTLVAPEGAAAAIHVVQAFAAFDNAIRIELPDPVLQMKQGLWSRFRSLLRGIREMLRQWTAS
jgi:hypothetical protein